jgi:hypothetical protein
MLSLVTQCQNGEGEIDMGELKLLHQLMEKSKQFSISNFNKPVSSFLESRINRTWRCRKTKKSKLSKLKRRINSYDAF